LKLVLDRGIAVPDVLLEFRSTQNGFHGAWKLGQDRVARGVEYPAMVFLDQPFDDRPAGPQYLEGLVLVLLDLVAEADDVGFRITVTLR